MFEFKYPLLQNVSLYDDDYYLQEIYVDISTYTDEELADEIDRHYESLQDVKDKHPEEWKRVIAGIIAENTEVDRETDLCFDDEDELIEYLEENYNIKV